MTPLRILLVCHGSPLQRMGGVGMVVNGLLEEFERAGHEVWLLTPNTAFLPSTKITGRHIEWSHPRWSWKQGWAPRDVRSLQSALQKIQFDVVHIHHLSGLPFNVWELLTTRAKVVTLHDYALPCALGQLVTRDGNICDGPKKDCATCIEPWTQSYSNKERNEMLQYRNALMHNILNESDLCLSPSHDLIERFRNFSKSSIEHCSLPLMRPLPARSPAPTGIIFIGSIIPTKGLHVLLRALALLEDPPQLTIIGGQSATPSWPDYGKQCSALAEQLECRWLGHIEHDEALSELACHKLLVLPSLWPENSPLVVREATGLGLNVIVSTIGGAAELSTSAYQVRPNDSTMLANTIRLALDSEAAEVLQWPSLETHCEMLINHYRRLL